MFMWRVELCFDGTKWYWECRDPGGCLISQSKRHFDTANDAKGDFEREFEDHWSCMKCRFAK